MGKKKTLPHDPETGEIIDPGAPFTSTSPAPYLRSLGMRPIALDDFGHEIPDPTPIAPPIGYKPQPSMVEIIRAQITSQRLAEEAEAAGMETFEEANDFDVDDDFDPSTPYEEMFDPDPPRPRFETAEETLNLRKDRPNRPEKPKEPETAPPATTPAPDPVKGAPAPGQTLDGPPPVKS